MDIHRKKHAALVFLKSKIKNKAVNMALHYASVLSGRTVWKKVLLFTFFILLFFYYFFKQLCNF
jgi:hypothetical protein